MKERGVQRLTDLTTAQRAVVLELLSLDLGLQHHHGTRRDHPGCVARLSNVWPEPPARLLTRTELERLAVVETQVDGLTHSTTGLEDKVDELAAWMHAEQTKRRLVLAAVGMSRMTVLTACALLGGIVAAADILSRVLMSPTVQQVVATPHP